MLIYSGFNERLLRLKRYSYQFLSVMLHVGINLSTLINDVSTYQREKFRQIKTRWQISVACVKAIIQIS